MDYETIKSHFKISEDHGDKCTGICPSHKDNKASLSINYDKASGKTLLICFAGCETRDILDAAGLKMTDLFDREFTGKSNSSKSSNIVSEYIYTDEKGNNLFSKVRFEPKHFSQKRIIDGATIWGLNKGLYYETYKNSNNWSQKKRENVPTKEYEGIEPVIYNLPQIIQTIKNNESIYIVEGEKDVNTLSKLGLTATCNFDGASKSTQKSKWHKEYNQYFKDAKVVILHDNDNSGIAHKDSIAANLFNVVEYIKCPELTEIEEKQDITDWITAGHTKEELISLVDRTDIYDSEEMANQSLIKFNFSDVGNAERLMVTYGRNIRYSPIRMNWFIWSGRHWEVDHNGKIENLARKVIRKFQIEGNSLPDEVNDKPNKLKQQISKFVLKSETDGRLKAMINQAKTFTPYILKETDQNVYLINYRNGTLNLHTGLLRKFERKDYLTKIVDLEFDPKAECLQWKKFINKIFMNDQELINYIQKSIGYSMTGDSNLQCFYILHGKGSNGKGTFIQAIERLLGSYYSTLSPESLMERSGNNEGAREDLAKLEGTRFVCVNECDENKYFDENLLKRMSSGSNEKFTVRRMYESYFDLRPLFKMWMTTNALPRIKGTDKGIWRRVRKIPFEYDFDLDEDKNVNFFQEKLVPELNGILNWALDGCLKWQQEGMKVPAVVEIAIEKYKSDMDPIARFIDETCIISETCKAKISELYDLYKDWCEENKEYKLSSIKLTKRLVDKGFKQIRTMNSRCWSGIGILDNENQIGITECKDKITPFNDKN